MSLINYAEDPILADLPGVEGKHRGETARVRELHFGLANLMPDSAYIQTIRDWAQLINLADQSLKIHLHYLNLEGVQRTGAAAEHAERYGSLVGDSLEKGLDGVVITGANTEHDYERLEQVPYINDFNRLVTAIEEGPITSGLFSCFAFHTLMETKFGVERTLGNPAHDQKVWGVVPHFVPPSARDHFLVRGGDTHFNAVSSRWGDISVQQAEAAGFTVLNQADDVRHSVGAVVDSKMNFVGVQTHSEYDSLGLLKEFLRDWNLFQNGQGKEPARPTFLTARGSVLLEDLLKIGGEISNEIRRNFYGVIEPEVKVTWKSPGTALIHRWVSGVLKLTSYDRHTKYMRGVDPENPMQFLAI